MNKKAIAPVISVTLIILISILAVGILSTYIIKSSKSIQLSPETSCLDLKLNQALKINSVCYNETTNEVKTNINRVLNTQLFTIDFTLSSTDKTEKWKVGGSCLNCKLPEEGESKTYYLDSTSTEKRTLILSTVSCELDRKEVNICT